MYEIKVKTQAPGETPRYEYFIEPTHAKAWTLAKTLVTRPGRGTVVTVRIIDSRGVYHG